MTVAGGISPFRPENAPAGSVWRPVVAVRYAILGDLRFLSHHDELRMLNRWLRRAAWPIAYSEGYNPIPRIKMPLPRNLGCAATEQVALIELLERADAAAALHQRLIDAAPPGVTEIGTTTPLTQAMLHAREVEYSVELSEAEADAIRPAIQAALDARQLMVTREMGPDKPARQIDVRGFVRALMLDGYVLRMRLLVTNQATARPVEILQILGMHGAGHSARAVRNRITWDTELPLVAAPSRKTKED